MIILQRDLSDEKCVYYYTIILFYAIYIVLLKDLYDVYTPCTVGTTKLLITMNSLLA